LGLFSGRILTVLNDGKHRLFAEPVGEVGFGRNTLKLRLKRLAAQSLMVKEKTVSNGRGSQNSPTPYHPEPDGKFPLLSETRP
jgi:hypothetical protein